MENTIALEICQQCDRLPTMMKLIYFICILGLLFFSLVIFYAFKRFSRESSLKVLFKDFNRKMWMTVCLGFIFFGFYLCVILLSRYWIPQWGTNLFFLMYQHPIPFVYGGLFLFAFLSLSIYLARMFIKYLYLTRGKDS